MVHQRKCKRTIGDASENLFFSPESLKASARIRIHLLELADDENELVLLAESLP